LGEHGAVGRDVRLSRWTALALLLLLAHAALIVLDARAMNLATDESNYLHCGHIILHHGWLTEGAIYQGPLPLYANQLFIGDFPSGGLKDAVAQHELVFRGRLGTLPFALLSAAILFVWARRLFGDSGGLLTLLLHVSNPLLLGYGSLML